MIRLSLSAAAIILMTACASPGSAPSPRADENLCRARELQPYVGRPRSELPATPAGVTRREVCASCAMTMDYNGRRQTVVYEDTTNLVASIRCG